MGQVKHLNFYDIVLDFILMDSFEDLENPPVSIQNVVNNRWLNNSFKETVSLAGEPPLRDDSCCACPFRRFHSRWPCLAPQAVASSCWSVLKQKRQHMKVQDCLNEQQKLSSIPVLSTTAIENVSYPLSSGA